MPINSTMKADMPPAGASPDPVADFVCAVSHDLRAPLLNFHGFLRRLAAACQTLDSLAAHLPAEQRADWQKLYQQKIQTSVQILEQNAARMDRLLLALLELARAGSGLVQMQIVDAASLAEKVIDEFASEAEQKKVSLAFKADQACSQGESIEIWADPDRLLLMLRQLVSNAIKFLSPDRPGEVRVGVAVQDGLGVCWVQDNGIGIREADLNRIFLPLGTVQETGPSAGGTGLAIVRKLMQQQGGRVRVESERDCGSCFFLHFPAEPQPAGGWPGEPQSSASFPSPEPIRQ